MDSAPTPRPSMDRGDSSGRIQHRMAALVRSGRMPAFFAMAGGMLLLYGFLLSGDFLVGSVVVNGTTIGNPAQVVTVADAIGEPIFTIDASESAERVAALPYVEHVTVLTRFPDRVVISVEERVPVVVWQVGAQPFLIDERGNVLAEQPREGLPSVVDEGALPTVGGTIPADRVAAVVAIRDALAESLDVLTWTTSDGLVARLNDKRIVIFGDTRRLPMKLAVYGEVIRLPESWSLLDLREPERPFYE